MNLLDGFKWYHLIILCLIAIFLYLTLTKKSHQNALENEGFDPEKQHGTIQNNFDAEIVLYYAMWCGYSKAFLPEWEKFEAFAKTNYPRLKITRMRCEDGNEATCSQKGVDGYPTVILYIGDSEKKFDGERTSDSLVRFVRENTKL